MLQCLSAIQRMYAKNSLVFAAGTPAESVGVVLSGRVDIVQEDFWGSASILARLEPGDLFGEAFSSAQVVSLPVSVIAVEDSEILLLDYQRILTTCTGACKFHDQLIANMLKVLAQKNIALTQKMEHLTRRTTREKLLSYLSTQALRAGSNAFTIPFNRQELSAYLAVDRSAMSSELGRMQREGLLTFDKNHFTLAP